MKLRVNYEYTENEIPPRCRKPRPVRHAAEAVLTIREITAAEAPIAIRRTTKSELGWDPLVYRWFAGKLWVNVDDRGKQLGPVSENDIGGYPWQSKAGVLKEMRAQARAILLIDGERWRPSGEPRYVVMTFGLGHNHGLGWGTSLSTSHGYNSNVGRGRYFRIDQYREALAETERIARARGDTKALPVEETQQPDTFEILIPEAVKLQPQKQHGAGDPFLNKIESVIEGSSSSAEAGLLSLMVLAKEIAQ